MFLSLQTEERSSVFTVKCCGLYSQDTHLITDRALKAAFLCFRLGVFTHTENA